MKKLILSGMAVAMLALPAVSSANVQRYQSQTVTFTATQPKDRNHQFEDVWTHTITATVNPCDNTFTGTARIEGTDGTKLNNEAWTGSFGANNTVNFTMTRPGTDGNETGTLTMDGTTVGHPETSVPNGYVDQIDMIASAPSFTNASNYKNHGDYVKSQGGGDDAAHSCIGMPINSSK
jgi:hypothetical protein